MVSGELAAVTGPGRTPHGVRGLKCIFDELVTHGLGRTPHGVRGLKWTGARWVRRSFGRTPHGVRGLKFNMIRNEASPE